MKFKTVLQLVFAVFMLCIFVYAVGFTNGYAYYQDKIKDPCFIYEECTKTCTQNQIKELNSPSLE